MAFEFRKRLDEEIEQNMGNSYETLSEKLKLMGTPASDQTIRQWMGDQGLRLRSISKVISPGSSGDGNSQFERIAELIDQYQADDNPDFSIDRS